MCKELLPPNVKFESLSKQQQKNALRLAKGLEALREDLGLALVVNTYHRGGNRKYSGFRTKYQNNVLLKLLGYKPSPTSLHMEFLAADVICYGKTPKQVAAAAKRVGFTEIIVYNSFTHCAYED